MLHSEDKGAVHENATRCTHPRGPRRLEDLSDRRKRKAKLNTRKVTKAFRTIPVQSRRLGTHLLQSFTRLCLDTTLQTGTGGGGHLPRLMREPFRWEGMAERPAWVFSALVMFVVVVLPLFRAGRTVLLGMPNPVPVHK